MWIAHVHAGVADDRHVDRESPRALDLPRDKPTGQLRVSGEAARSLAVEFRSEATAYADVPDQQSLEHEEPDAVRKTVRPVAGPGATRNPHDSRDAFLDRLSANRSGNRLSQIDVLTKHVADRSRAKSPGGHASTAMCAAAGSHAG